MATKDEIIRFLREEFPQFTQTIEEVVNGQAVIRHTITRDNLRPGGTVSGPTMFEMVDSALYVAVLGQVGIIPLAVTSNITINFLRKPAASGDLLAKCTLLKAGRTLITGEVSIYAEGDDAPVAHAVGTYAIPPNRTP